MYYVYVLRCADDSLYTGVTNDLEKRMKAHKEGKGSKYVRSRLPFTLIYSERKRNKIYACKRESEIKSWPRSKKIGEFQLASRHKD